MATSWLIDATAACECAHPGCTCTGEQTDLLVNGTPRCACCFADCPDVHPDDYSQPNAVEFRFNN